MRTECYRMNRTKPLSLSDFPSSCSDQVRTRGVAGRWGAHTPENDVCTSVPADWILPPQLWVKEVGYHWLVILLPLCAFEISRKDTCEALWILCLSSFFGSGVLCFDFRNHFKYSYFIVPLDRLFTTVPECCIPLFALFLATVGDFLVYFPNFKTLSLSTVWFHLSLLAQHREWSRLELVLERWVLQLLHIATVVVYIVQV